MKKLVLLFIGVISMPILNAQNISDALRYSQSEIQGTARFRAMSGAFGAVGGDQSSVSLNPAGSALFKTSEASVTFASIITDNDIQYFNGFSNTSDANLDFQQAGVTFVFSSWDSPWKRLTLSVGYDKFQNFNSDWFAFGNNTKSIDSYFLYYAQGLPLSEMSAFPDESITSAYADIGSIYGFGNQQAFLGYESYILEPDMQTDGNTLYYSNIAPGEFNQEYLYAASGYNGKVSFNIATQYQDNLFLGLNLNSHLLNYDRSTRFYEENSNVGTLVNEVGFDNFLSTYGWGFSFQLGGILKLNEFFRVGLTYDSPTWLTIEEETSQYISTVRNETGSDIVQIIDPRIVNVFPSYKLQTPGKITGSLAFVFENHGIISFDYSTKNYGNTKFKPTSDSYFAVQNNMISERLTTASTYKIGGEYNYDRFSFRGGYRFEESPYKDNTIDDLTGYSLGIGYNFGKIKLDLTYDQSKQNMNYQLFDQGLTDSANIDAKKSNVILSLSFNI